MRVEHMPFLVQIFKETLGGRTAKDHSEPNVKPRQISHVRATRLT